MEPRLRRWLGVAGIVFVVLFLVSSFITPATPSAHASVDKAVNFYQAHRAAFTAQAWIIELAVLVGVFFFWYLRDYLGQTDQHRRLATVGFAGALLFAVSGGLAGGIDYALASSVNHASGTSIQTMNVLQNYWNVFVGSSGVAIFLVATGLVCILSGVLARWVGWLGIVLAVASLVLPFIAAPAAGLWVLITSIVILVQNRGVASAPVAMARPAGSTG